MKRLLILSLIFALVTSCTKDEVLKDVGDGEKALLSVSLSTETCTKAYGIEHGVQADDNTIQTLEIFVFRINEGNPDNGALDVYKKFSSEELKRLSDLQVYTTLGKKMIYIVANSHRENWAGINNRVLFEQQMAYLKDENVKNFTMTGSAQVEMTTFSTVPITIKRMVARIKLLSVRTAFAGSVYQGIPLTDVKAYLINVQGAKYIYNNTGNDISILNNGEYVESDVLSCAMDGIISDNLTDSINDEGYNVSHYFYCYENEYTEEENGKKFTKLVIEGKLNGTTYYYPIPIKGIIRNHCYTISVTISKPGSVNPQIDVEKGILGSPITVTDWVDYVNNNITF